MLDFTLPDQLSDGLVLVDSARRFVPASVLVLFRFSGFLLITKVQIIHIGLESMKSTEGIQSVLILSQRHWQCYPPSAEHGRFELRVHFLQIGWSETPYRGIQIYQLELCRNGL